MLAKYPKFIQEKPSIFGLEVIDFFVIGLILIICSFEILQVSFISMNIIVAVYIVLRKILLRRPKKHWSYFLKSLKERDYLFIRERIKK